MSRVAAIVVLAAAAALSACASAKVFRMTDQTYSPVPQDSVLVFPVEEDVHRPYEKIAILYAEASYNSTNEQKLVALLRKKAAEIGASAIVLAGYEKPSTGQKIAHVFLATKANEKMQALAIRFTDAGADRK